MVWEFWTMLQVNNSYNRLYYFEFLDKFRISNNKKEFHLFSMFLFEEQIKSQLVKEIRFYKDSIDELNETVSLFFTKTKNMNMIN